MTVNRKPGGALAHGRWAGQHGMRVVYFTVLRANARSGALKGIRAQSSGAQSLTHEAQT